MRVPNSSTGEKRLLIAVFPDQKHTHRIKKPDGTYVDLCVSMPGLFYEDSEHIWNGWNQNPTIGRAITACDEIEPGDLIITQQNALTNDASKLSRNLTEELQDLADEGEEIYAVDKGLAWVGFRKLTGERYCIGESVICKRIYKPIPETESGVVGLLNKEQHKNLLYVEQIPNHVTDIKVGDIIPVAKNSDCEVKYVMDNKHASLIRMNYKRDFCGAVIEDLEYEFYEEEGKLQSV